MVCSTLVEVETSEPGTKWSWIRTRDFLVSSVIDRRKDAGSVGWSSLLKRNLRVASSNPYAAGKLV